MHVWNSVETWRNKLQAPAQTSKLCPNLRLYMLPNLIIEAMISTFPRPSPKSAVQRYGGSGHANFGSLCKVQNSNLCTLPLSLHAVTLRDYFILLELNGIPCLSLLLVPGLLLLNSNSCFIFLWFVWVWEMASYWIQVHNTGEVQRRNWKAYPQIVQISCSTYFCFSSYLFCSISHR